MRVKIISNEIEPIMMNNYEILPGENIIYDTANPELIYNGFSFYKNYYSSISDDKNIELYVDEALADKANFEFILNTEQNKYKDFEFQLSKIVHFDLVDKCLTFKDPQTDKIYKVELVEVI